MLKKLLKNKAKVIEETNPDKIYVENVRSFFNIPTKWAKYLCELAVRQNVFRKRYGVMCKNSDCHRIIEVFNSQNDIPDELECYVCQSEGKDHVFKKEELDVIEFYQLNDKKQ